MPPGWLGGDVPPLQTGLLAPSAAPKLHHVLASLALAALGLLAHLRQGEISLSAGRSSRDATGRGYGVASGIAPLWI